MHTLIRLTLFTLLALALTACRPTPPPTPSPVPPTATATPEPTATPVPPTATPEPVVMDLVDTLQARGNFSILLQIIQQTDLVEKLKSEGPFTLFAPDDAAFAALPEGTLASWQADPTGPLTDVLLYHLVAGQLSSADLAGAESLTTILGDPLPVSAQGEVLQVGNAQVVQPDVPATNGVIHQVDAVLLPPSLESGAP
ncbi:MAG: hypothetical protein KatS3mg050_1286 [Litorilinea sp.]|nr:MAG: hypothetical protein KatS3mg050_1286 [Litorilinea sp.]